MNPFKRAFFDPSRNLLLFIVIALIILPFIANGIFDLVWNTGTETVKQSLGIKDKNTVQIFMLLSLVILVIFMIYGTDLVRKIESTIRKTFSPQGRLTTNIKPVETVYAGLIAFMSVRGNSPAEKAIRFHWDEGRNPNFLYCWLICSEKSVDAAKDLIARLAQERCLPNVQIFWGDYKLKNENDPNLSLIVPEEFVDDPNYIQKTIDCIYLDAQEKGISESQIIADYTGGTKSMTAGMTIACADPQRHLEYIVQSDATPIMEVDISYNVRPIRRH